MDLPDTCTDYLQALLLDHYRPICLRVDRTQMIVAVRGDAERLPMPSAKLLGTAITETVPVFFTTQEITRTPWVQLPGWVDVNDIVVLPTDTGWDVLLIDVTTAHGSRSRDQQRYYQALLKQNVLAGEHRQARAQLKQISAQANDQADFIAALSHELKTPITSLLGYAEQLVETALEPELREQVVAIKRIALSQLSLVENLLIGGVEAERGKLSADRFSLGELLAELRSLFQPIARAKGLRISVDAPVPDQAVLGDRFRLRQVMVNLVTNAIRYTHQGSVCLAAEHNTHDVRLVVADTGPGIGIEEARRIFDVGFRGHASWRGDNGLGIGLPTSLKIARALGGSLELENPGDTNGARFVLTLPWSVAPECVAGRAGLGVLVVDDDPDIGHMIVRSLGGLGHTALLADSIASAQQLLQSQCFDVVITDLNLTDGSGIDLGHELAGGTRLWLLSAADANHLFDERELAIFEQILRKPDDVFRLPTLVGALVS